MTEGSSDTPILDLIAVMTAASLEASTLDPRAFMLARLAALVAVDAPPASYLLNLSAASDAGVDADQVRGLLAAIAPIVGTPRIVAATGNIVRALGFAIEVADMEADATE
jgi:4-carboxymuconolactone decarboxylase